MRLLERGKFRAGICRPLPVDASMQNCIGTVHEYGNQDGGNYSATAAAKASTTAIFCSNSFGKPCRCSKYAGLLYETHTVPSRSWEI